ncbi:IclR family transcriptional regulator domain-containing protein, partial [Georgenia subflava]
RPAPAARSRHDVPAPTGQPASEGLQALARGLAVLRALAGAPGPMTLAQVAQGAGLNRAVARRVLLTLAEAGYVLGRGRDFSLRPRVLELGEAYRSALRLPDLAVGAMRRLSAETGHSISLAVLDGADIVYVERVPGSRIIDTVLPVGTRLPALSTAMGRVLLAGLDPAELDAHLGSLPPGTGPVDGRALRAQLDEVRDVGHCRVDDELERGHIALAAPVQVTDGRVVAAVNLPLTVAALPGGHVRTRHAEAVTACARAVSAAVARHQLRRPGPFG